ncbi:hypothetical protein IU470_29825 [Nocardia abscessus]|uniref:Terpene synthase n=1 Tax=Nocardia abscessus TaxID=120957 RepID=A0ABS0CG16_9NOCA|nr:terpene synthase family protein [Nocardia abscessus]MBF6229276.1 hypothetical protein [Nocardia abscessus]
MRHELCEPGSLATQTGFARGIAPAIPYADETTVLAATKHFMWGSLLDDHWDTHSDLPRIDAHCGELQRVMAESPDAPLPPGDRWAASLQDLRAQLETVLTDTEFAVFRYEHTVWLHGQSWYTALQQRATPPGIGEWLRMRWAKVGVGTLVPFTGASMGSLQMTPRMLDEPVVRAFTRATMLACSVLNDLFSAAKEAVAGTATTNLITVLTHAEGGEPAAAATAAWRLYERIVVAAVGLQQRLLTDPRPAVARFATELPRWIPAGLQWASTTARYHQHGDSPDTGHSITPPALVVSAAPTLWDPADLTPPPYPEIAWWWAYLN